MQSVVLLVLLAIASSQATSYYYVPANSTGWVQTFKGLQAGDTLTFGAGTYDTAGSKLSATFAGTKGAPILIQGEPGASLAVTIVQSANQNGFDTQGTWYTFRNFIIQATGYGGLRGFRFGEQGDASHVEIDNVKVVSTTSAITANDNGRTFSNFYLHNIELYGQTGTGECFYVGASHGLSIITNSIFEGIYCHDTSHDGGSGAGVQIKTGSYNNTVRYSVFHSTGGPCILTYDYNRTKDPSNYNLIYDNLCITSSDNGIQVGAGALVANNIVVGASASAVSVANNDMLQDSKIRDVAIVHNTLICTAGGNCLTLAGDQGSNSGTFVIVNNFVQQTNQGANAINLQGAVPASTSNIVGNMWIGSTDFSCTSCGSTISDPKFSNPGVPFYDYYPESGSSLIGAGSALAQLYVSTDYNCNARSAKTPTVGALEYSASSAANPVAPTPSGFRPVCSTSGGPPSGSTSTGSSTPSGATSTGSSTPSGATSTGSSTPSGATSSPAGSTGSKTSANSIASGTERILAPFATITALVMYILA